MLREVKDNHFEYDHIAKLDKGGIEKAFKFCEGYKDFLNNSKTERECVKSIIEIAKKNGYKEFKKSEIKNLNPNDKFYVNNRNKSVILWTMGKMPLDMGINFVVSHIDSPRLDLKANPIYESDEIAYFKTHYYGGIKKYQWPTMPLSMFGRIFKEDGSYLDLKIGEKEEDTKFVITDLLPHLAQNQVKKTLAEGIEGEDLNIVIGSLPLEKFEEKDKEIIKSNVLNILNKEYGITEKDFVRAEIEFVPSNKASDIGFDRSLIAGYGQDDRVCAYPSLIAEIENKDNILTSFAVFTDKEEIGSEGNTGMVSNYLFDIIEDICDILNVKARDVYRNSICFSSDVNSAYDPSFSDVFEKRNCSFINKGVVLTKFTGHRGKADSNDCSAETMAKVLSMLDKNNVCWQTGELGKVDIGGGGTIAKYMSERNIDTLDVGVAVLSMHSPYELTSKLDIYHTYLAYKALLLNDNK